MTLQVPISATPSVQRARGALSISAQLGYGNTTRLKNLRQEGSYRAIFPAPSAGKLDAVLINTAGGITGGDQFSVSVTAQTDAHISVTTQAAERIYRAAAGCTGRISNHLRVAKAARLFWLPQETILFDGCQIDRALDVDVDATGSALILEPLVFGRQASGETLRSCAFQDRVSITSNGQPIYLDCIRMNGDLAAALARSAIAGGARAMASLVYVDPEARRLLAPCRALLPTTAGASMLSERVLVVRMLAQDSFALRAALLPILKLFTNDTVPKNWRL